MRSTTYADDPALLMRIVAKALTAGPRGVADKSGVPKWIYPVGAAAASPSSPAVSRPQTCGYPSSANKHPASSR